MKRLFCDGQRSVKMWLLTPLCVYKSKSSCFVRDLQVVCTCVFGKERKTCGVVGKIPNFKFFCSGRKPRWRKISTRTDLEIGKIKNCTKFTGLKNAALSRRLSVESWKCLRCGGCSFFGDCVLICITSTTCGQRGVKKPDATQKTSLELLFLTSLYVRNKYWPLLFIYFYITVNCTKMMTSFFFSLMPWKADYFGVIATGWHIANHACLCQRETLKNGGIKKRKMSPKTSRIAQRLLFLKKMQHEVEAGTKIAAIQTGPLLLYWSYVLEMKPPDEALWT